MRVPTARNGPVCDFDRTVTPMVDVVFQLLVFFVLASGGRVAEQTLSTVLPAGSISAAESANAPKRPIADVWLHLARVAAKQRTKVELAGRRYDDLSTLEAALRELSEQAAQSRIILDVGGDVPLGDVIFIYDACRAARFGSINFAASPEEIRPNP